MRRGRVLLAFAVAGLALHGLSALVSTPERPLLRVWAGAERERSIDEALLVELGLAGPWQTDPLIRERLLGTMTRLEPAEPDWITLLQRASELDLPRRDPLVRARLAERARRSLPEPGTPSEVELLAWYATHAAELMSPPVVTFEHRFGDDEPELTLGRRPTRTVAALARALGEPAALRIDRAPIGVWTRVTSPLGTHQVRVIARREAQLAPFETVRARVLEAWRRERRVAIERASLAALRTRFVIEDGR